MQLKEYAIFDLDYTIIPHDTIFLFANYILKKYPWRIYYIFFVILAIPFALLRILRSKELKQIFLSFLWGIRKDELETFSKAFVKEIISPLVYPELKNEIQYLKHQNKILILNTAAPDFYAKYIGEELGFHYVIATPFEIKPKQKLFPRIIGSNNKSYEKIKRMIPYLEDIYQNTLKNFKPHNSKKPIYPILLKNSIAYSDSINDLPLLRLTEKAKLINPVDGELIKEAMEKDWEILRPRTPYRNSIEKYWIILKQSLGLYF